MPATERTIPLYPFVKGEKPYTFSKGNRHTVIEVGPKVIQNNLEVTFYTDVADDDPTRVPFSYPGRQFERRRQYVRDEDNPPDVNLELARASGIGILAYIEVDDSAEEGEYAGTIRPSNLTVVGVDVFCRLLLPDHLRVSEGYDYEDTSVKNIAKKQRQEREHTVPLPSGLLAPSTLLRIDAGRLDPFCKAPPPDDQTLLTVSSFHRDGETLIFGQPGDREKVAATVAMLKEKNAAEIRLLYERSQGRRGEIEAATTEEQPPASIKPYKLYGRAARRAKRSEKERDK